MRPADMLHDCPPVFEQASDRQRLFLRRRMLCHDALRPAATLPAAQPVHQVSEGVLPKVAQLDQRQIRHGHGVCPPAGTARRQYPQGPERTDVAGQQLGVSWRKQDIWMTRLPCPERGTPTAPVADGGIGRPLNLQPPSPLLWSKRLARWQWRLVWALAVRWRQWPARTGVRTPQRPRATADSQSSRIEEPPVNSPRSLNLDRFDTGHDMPDIGGIRARRGERQVKAGVGGVGGGRHRSARNGSS